MDRFSDFEVYDKFIFHFQSSERSELDMSCVSLEGGVEEEMAQNLQVHTLLHFIFGTKSFFDLQSLDQMQEMEFVQT